MVLVQVPIEQRGFGRGQKEGIGQPRKINPAHRDFESCGDRVVIEFTVSNEVFVFRPVWIIKHHGTIRPIGRGVDDITVVDVTRPRTSMIR